MGPSPTTCELTSSIDSVNVTGVPRTLSDADLAAFRDVLCDAAEAAFAEHGVAGVTMRTLADLVGVSRMTPYRYYEDKAAIVAAVRARGFSRLADVMEAVAEATPEPATRLHRLGEAYLAFAADHPDRYRLMHEIAQDDEQRYPDLVRQIRRSQQPLLDACRDAADEGIVGLDPVDAMHVLWAGLHGLNALQLADKLHVGRSAESLAPVMLAALGRGVSPSRTSPARTPGADHEQDQR